MIDFRSMDSNPSVHIIFLHNNKSTAEKIEYIVDRKIYKNIFNIV